MSFLEHSARVRRHKRLEMQKCADPDGLLPKRAHAAINRAAPPQGLSVGVFGVSVRARRGV
jgi:hypothetical protein